LTRSKQTSQSRESIHGRGASWSPANRFEKLHVDLTDVDLVDDDTEGKDNPRRSTQYFDDKTKAIVAAQPTSGCRIRIINGGVVDHHSSHVPI
jgi:hypothetical protein